MATVRISRTLPHGEAEAYASPRDDLMVAERPVPATAEAGPSEAGRAADGATSVERHEFEGTDGPFTTWRRAVRLERGADGTTVVHEQTDFRLAIPVWGVLFGPLMRRQVAARSAAIAGDDHRPWWSPPDRFDARASAVAASCATLAVLGGFLGGLVGATLTYVGSEMDAGARTQTTVLAVIRIGALLTLVGMILADRIGRRRVIRTSFVVAALAAGVGALAPDLVTVTAAQTVCRGAIAVGVILLAVVAAEEVPAGSRAFILGLITLAGALGVGGVIALLPVADLELWAWRGIWALGLVSIPITLRVVRDLPESRRFTALVQPRPAGAAAPAEAPAPPVEASPGGGHEGGLRARRLVAASLIAMLLNLFATPATQLQNEYLRTERGYSGILLVLFIFGTNTWGGIGVILGGRLADRRSRHLAAMIGLTGLAIGNAIMFSTSGWLMWAGSLVGSVVGAATIPSIGVLGPELFPTRKRATANGWINVAAVSGAVVGLWLAGWLIDRSGYATALWWLTLAPLAVAVVMWWVPETARHELEEINDTQFDDDSSSILPENAR